MTLTLSQTGPSFVDFGSVCVESVCVQTLQLVNRLPACVWVQLEADCPELQGSSPLSYVLPPHTHTSFPLTFESNQLGPFSRLGQQVRPLSALGLYASGFNSNHLVFTINLKGGQHISLFFCCLKVTL